LLLALLSSVLSLLPARFFDWHSRFLQPGLPALALPSPAAVFSRLQALAEALEPGSLELAPELPDIFTFTPPTLPPLMPVIELPPLTLPSFSGKSMLVLAALAGAVGMAGQFALFLRRRELEE